MLELALFAVALVLIGACGIFVAAEFALITVNRPTVERLAEKGDGRARQVLHALRTLSTQLSSAQVGITITNLAIGFLAEPAIAGLIKGPLGVFGLPDTTVSGIAIVIGLIVATALTMIFGELVPKNIAIAKPLATAKIVQRPLLIFTWAVAYPIRLLNGSANLILARFGISPQEELASARSADELLSLVRRSAQKGSLAKETAQMLERSLTFSDLTALDVMTPRTRVKSVQAEQSAADILALAKSSGLSRFPVYGMSLDDVRGMVHIKQAIGVARKERDVTPAKAIMRSPVLVPSSIQLEPLLRDLKAGGLQMAIVVDEFGAVDGIVTMEDLLEELVGEVRDEHDRSAAAIQKRGGGSWSISGLLRPDEIGEELGLYLPEEEEVETVAGLFTHHLEKIPKVGDRVVIDAIDRDGETSVIELTVERMEGYRVDRFRMKIVTKKTKERSS